MTTTTPQPSSTEFWNVIKKEITGIQLLWETVNGMYFKPLGKDWQALQTDAPMLIHLMQTTLMESLLMRVSRLMDPDSTGKKTNLSLCQLVKSEASVAVNVQAVRSIWDDSKLKVIRDKYLSHNDLAQSLTEAHTLNIPLKSDDITALEKLTEGLRALRRDVNHKLSGCSYVDQSLDLQVHREIEALGKVLLGGEQFFKLLPDHACLQRAIESEGKQQ